MVEEATQPAPAEGAAGPQDEAAPIRLLEGDALDPLVQSQCSLSVQLRRATGSIVGRSTELNAIAQAIREAKTRLTAVTLEGEPGIGKTRLLVATAEMTEAAGFTSVAITADEEIRGPFLVGRSLFANGAIREAAVGTRAEVALRRVVEALGGRDEPGFANLSPEAKLLRAFDLAGLAIGELARIKPLALLIDDVQWADDDTLRMLRYAVRSVADQPVFLFLSLRPDEFATVPEASNFVADMERMGLVRRLRVTRFSASETAQLLRQVLGGPVEGQSAAAIQAQSEGVPFIVEELARAHREAGTIQQVDGEWRLGRNAARLVPSAVRTLISRRATHLPAATLAILGDAGVLGRSFSVRDVLAIQEKVGSGKGSDGAGSAAAIAASMRPAVDTGLLLAHPEGDAADFTFTHEQVREFAVNQLSNARRREVHGAVVDLLLEGGEAPAQGLQMLAQHALAAGDTERAARFSIDAAAAALKSNAPDEALRLVDAALPVVSAPADRRVLLTCRDDAYAVLRRSSDRLDGLAELGALAEAMRDSGLELDVQLRRAAALRAAHDEDAAADLARRVRDRAVAAGDKAAELRANLELGQALSKTELGDSMGGVTFEDDLAGAEEAFRRAVTLAEELDDERMLAAALREVAALVIARLRTMFVHDVIETGQWLELARRLQQGEPLPEIVAGLPLGTLVGEAGQLLERALGIYERLDDRSGVMATVIAMAYLSYAPLIHLSSSARHLEEIKRVISRQTELVTESERAKQELHLLYGIHVFGRAKSLPDVALSRGEEAYRAARLLGDQSIQFGAAGGVALTHLSLGDIVEAERWLNLAAEIAAATPTPTRSRQLESWRGTVRAAAGDAAGMREHLERAVSMATAQGKAAARCEALARLAVEAARLGKASGDEELFRVAEDAANQVEAIAGSLSGHPQWPIEAMAALATVHLARGDTAEALAAAQSAIERLVEANHEDRYFDITLPAGEVLAAAAPPEALAFARSYMQLELSRIVQGTLDDEIRARWLRGPVGSRLVALVGEPITREASSASADAPDIDDADRVMLQLLTEGMTNREMASRLGISEQDVAKRLARIIATLGATDRAQATSIAFRGLAPVAA
ncbi:MAG TPA: AAA family ATPase [Patescibacteria group bacterium]|nr:AAA family ATPase [Patescibacteria group bacterium]